MRGHSSVQERTFEEWRDRVSDYALDYARQAWLAEQPSDSCQPCAEKAATLGKILNELERVDGLNRGMLVEDQVGWVIARNHQHESDFNELIESGAAQVRGLESQLAEATRQISRLQLSNQSNQSDLERIATIIGMRWCCTAETMELINRVERLVKDHNRLSQS